MWNWLRVFRSTAAGRTGLGVGQQRHTVAQGYLCNTHMQELRIRLIPHQRSLITSYDTHCCIY
jgi:hypothetical protein